ncbi:MAG TPA: hypothetical protein VG146_02100 [Verrucomicrobiae bacterium]|nr:hypothetical protein [Verrucomicrobiae bacterium]
MSFVLEQAPSLISGKWTQIGISPTLNYSNLQHQVTIPKPGMALLPICRFAG